MKLIKLIALLFFFFSTSAHANYITNGSFESGPSIGPSNLIRVPKPSGPTIPSTALTGWNVTANNVEYIKDGSFGLTAQDGDKFIDLTGGDSGFGTIEQIVNLMVGTQYQLGFYLGASNMFTATGRDNGLPSVMVGISGLIDQTFTGSRNSANDWQQFTYSFIAQQASTTISFTGLQDDLCCYIGLDNITLVPEPGTIALFGLGLLGLGIGRRKK